MAQEMREPPYFIMLSPGMEHAYRRLIDFQVLLILWYLLICTLRVSVGWCYLHDFTFRFAIIILASYFTISACCLRRPLPSRNFSTAWYMMLWCLCAAHWPPLTRMRGRSCAADTAFRSRIIYDDARLAAWLRTGMPHFRHALPRHGS